MNIPGNIAEKAPGFVGTGYPEAGTRNRRYRYRPGSIFTTRGTGYAGYPGSRVPGYPGTR